MSWTAIRYRDFYDLPRIFITIHQGRQYLFDCPFDDELDEYADSYRVYELPALPDAELQGSWEHLPDSAIGFLGLIPVASVRFDPTRRACIDATVFRELPEPQTTRVA